MNPGDTFRCICGCGGWGLVTRQVEHGIAISLHMWMPQQGWHITDIRAANMEPADWPDEVSASFAAFRLTGKNS